jgi:hypothetical protein
MRPHVTAARRPTPTLHYLIDLLRPGGFRAGSPREDFGMSFFDAVYWLGMICMVPLALAFVHDQIAAAMPRPHLVTTGVEPASSE